jgi:hypothetical protein
LGESLDLIRESSLVTLDGYYEPIGSATALIVETPAQSAPIDETPAQSDPIDETPVLSASARLLGAGRGKGLRGHRAAASVQSSSSSSVQSAVRSDHISSRIRSASVSSNVSDLSSVATNKSAEKKARQKARQGKPWPKGKPSGGVVIPDTFDEETGISRSDGHHLMEDSLMNQVINVDSDKAGISSSDGHHLMEDSLMNQVIHAESDEPLLKKSRIENIVFVKRELAPPVEHLETHVISEEPLKRDCWLRAINNVFGHEVTTNDELQRVADKMMMDWNKNGGNHPTQYTEDGNYTTNVIESFFQWCTNYRFQKVCKKKTNFLRFDAINGIVNTHRFLILVMRTNKGNEKVNFHCAAVRDGMVYDDMMPYKGQKYVSFDKYKFRECVMVAYEFVRV